MKKLPIATINAQALINKNSFATTNTMNLSEIARNQERLKNELLQSIHEVNAGKVYTEMEVKQFLHQKHGVCL